jgi:predicted acetyltransferase
VITTASARFIGNTKQTSMVMTTGPFTQDVRSYFQDWTLAELFVLNRYRRRAM